MFNDITLDDLFELQKEQELVLIDVRSPSEYFEATIPGSLNIPLFTDSERAEVGRLYKQVSIEAAEERGLEIVSAKLPQFIKEFKNINSPKLVFCWRGGMRSKTTATLLDLIRMNVYRLKGGFRSYREWVSSTLKTFEIQSQSFVLNGYTGTGKTTMLHRLRQLGYPVLDLEGMANHRGSVFGQIGLMPNNQKKFDSLLCDELLRLKDERFVLMEAESKRIGKIVLPEFLIKNKEKGTQLFIDLPIEERVRNIVEDYRPSQHHDKCLEAFQIIAKHIHTPIAKQIETDIKTGNYSSAIFLLLKYYYDPRYEYKAKQSKEQYQTIKASNLDEAIQAIQAFLDTLRTKVM